MAFELLIGRAAMLFLLLGDETALVLAQTVDATAGGTVKYVVKEGNFWGVNNEPLPPPTPLTPTTPINTFEQ